MSRVDAAAPDRLPWLPDEPAPRKAIERRIHLLVYAAAAILFVAIGFFFLGVRSVREPQPSSANVARPRASVPLPTLRTAPPPEVRIATPPEVQPIAEPQVRPSPAREVKIAVPPAQKAVHRARSRSVHSSEPRGETVPTAGPQALSAVRVIATPPAQYAIPRPWPPRVIRGASGRLVQIGAFGSPYQAKRGWWFMVRAYPAVAHLPAVVTKTRNSRGRSFFRFQVGTTSQAHSEVLCQRMRMIGLSCAVVGLPWRATVER